MAPVTTPFCQQVRNFFGCGPGNRSTEGSDPTLKIKSSWDHLPPRGLLSRFGACQRFNNLSTQQQVARVIGGPHVKMFAGGLIAYGLATWWLGGSGLLLAFIGAAIWLISTVTGICTAVHNVNLANEECRTAVASPSNALFTEASAAIGFATPAGWVILIVWDLCSIVESIGDCCSVKKTGLKPARNLNTTQDEDDDELQAPAVKTTKKAVKTETVFQQTKTTEDLLA